MKTRWVFLTGAVCFFFGFIGCLAIVPPKKIAVEKIVEVEKPVVLPEHKRNAHNLTVCLDTLKLSLKANQIYSDILKEFESYCANPIPLLVKLGELKEIKAQIDKLMEQLQAPPKNNIISL